MIDIKHPKDIQEGTANHVALIVNACEAGDVKGAGYLADDLLDQLVSKALVVTLRVAPLDHQQIQAQQKAIGDEAYQRGLAEGRRLASAEVRKDLNRRLAEVLQS